jgi:RNA polymerase sigma-70 factor (ECF subfamily)
MQELITRSLVDDLSPTLLRYARRSLSAADAEDVLQAMWIAALRSAGSFGGRAPLRGWLKGILRHLICDHKRRRLAEPLCEDDVPSHDDDPLDLRDLRHAAAQATVALSCLSSAERRAVELVDLDDTTREQAAEHLNVTRAHLRVLLFRARTKLSVRLTASGIGADVLTIRPRTRPKMGSQGGRSSTD